MKDGHGAHSVLTDASSILRRRNRQGLSSICQGPRMRQNRMAGRRSQHWHIEAASGQPRPSRPYGAPQDEAGERLQPGSTGSVAPHFSRGSPRNSRAGRLQIGMEAGELPYRHQHRQEAATGLRQAIFDMRRLLAEVARRQVRRPRALSDAESAFSARCLECLATIATSASSARRKGGTGSAASIVR